MADMEAARPRHGNEADPPTVDTRRIGYKSGKLGAGSAALLVAGPAAWALSQVLGRTSPQAVEAVYGGAVGAALGGALARATGWIPFSVAEGALAGFVLFELGRFVHALTRRGSRRRSLVRATLRVARDLSAAVAVFYLLWGLHYARPRLPERESWPPLRTDVELLARLTDQQVRQTNAAYLALHAGSEDAGHPTAFDELGSIDRALDAAWPGVVAELGLPASAGWARGPVKTLFISPLLHRLGLSGFYFPFTGEANLNASVPAVRLAHVMAHEKAHQRGVGPEDEANFLGWRVAASATHPLARYAAAVFAQGQLAQSLARHDVERARALQSALLPGVRRDLDELRAYWDRYRGPARDLSRTVNHAYLRGNRVEGGVESYGRSARLLVQFAQARGGDLGVGLPDSTASVPSSSP